MAKTASPFAGITLSDQTPMAQPGPDQRLFSPVSSQHATTTVRQGTKQATFQPSKVGTKEPRKLGNKHTSAQRETDDQPLFDLTESPYRNDTFAFTDSELDAIEDLKIDLRRKYDIKATKNSLIRCAVHLLVEDYKRKKGDSLAAQRLRRTAK